MKTKVFLLVVLMLAALAVGFTGCPAYATTMSLSLLDDNPVVNGGGPPQQIPCPDCVYQVQVGNITWNYLGGEYGYKYVDVAYYATADYYEQMPPWTDAEAHAHLEFDWHYTGYTCNGTPIAGNTSIEWVDTDYLNASWNDHYYFNFWDQAWNDIPNHIDQGYTREDVCYIRIYFAMKISVHCCGNHDPLKWLRCEEHPSDFYHIDFSDTSDPIYFHVH